MKTKQLSTRKLAERVGKAHSTIGRFLKAFPDAPRSNLDDFAAYYAKHALSISAGDQSNEYAVERVKKLRADRKLAEGRLRILEDAFLPKDKTIETISSLAAELASVLRFRLCSELPPQLGGLTAPEARLKIEKLLDQTFDDHREAVVVKFNQLESETKLASSQRSASKSKPRKAKK